MATAKKPATKKPATAKKTPAKKPVTKAVAAKKAPVKKKAAAKKTTAKAATGYSSFKRSTDEVSFNNFKVTRQTVYWVVLIAFIIIAQLWILKLQIDVASLLDIQQAELSAE